MSDHRNAAELRDAVVDVQLHLLQKDLPLIVIAHSSDKLVLQVLFESLKLLELAKRVKGGGGERDRARARDRM